MPFSVRTIPAAGRLSLLAITAACATLLSGCLATTPSMGENKGTVSGAAGGCIVNASRVTVRKRTVSPWW